MTFSVKNLAGMTISAVLGLALLFVSLARAAGPEDAADNWHVSSQVKSEVVTLKNRLGMELTGTLYVPLSMEQNTKHSAILVGHPLGAVRQQAANLYAVKMAEAGFVPLCFDQLLPGGGELGLPARLRLP